MFEQIWTAAGLGPVAEGAPPTLQQQQQQQQQQRQQQQQQQQRRKSAPAAVGPHAASALLEWQARGQRIMQRLLKLPAAQAFSEPVDTDEVEGYYDSIDNPMVRLFGVYRV